MRTHTRTHARTHARTHTHTHIHTHTHTHTHTHMANGCRTEIYIPKGLSTLGVKSGIRKFYLQYMPLPSTRAVVGQIPFLTLS